ncbi:MAG: hypothetical protein WC758_00130 [Candidatus Woesearchaeota archaeon]|jgi:hypothetical protein
MVIEKKGNNSKSRLFGVLRSAISRVGISVDGLKSEIEVTIDDAKKRIHEMMESLFSRIMIMFLLMLGLVFLFLGATYKIIQVGIDKGSAFLIVGVLILILGWVFLIILKK